MDAWKDICIGSFKLALLTGRFVAILSQDYGPVVHIRFFERHHRLKQEEISACIIDNC